MASLHSLPYLFALATTFSIVILCSLSLINASNDGFSVELMHAILQDLPSTTLLKLPNNGYPMLCVVPFTVSIILGQLLHSLPMHWNQK